VRRAGSEGLRRRSTSLEGGGPAEHDPSMQTFTAAMPEPGLEAEGGRGLDGALSLPCLGRAPGGATCLDAADVGALCHSGASLCCSWQVTSRSPGPSAHRTSTGVRMRRQHAANLPAAGAGQSRGAALCDCL